MKEDDTERPEFLGVASQHAPVKVGDDHVQNLQDSAYKLLPLKTTLESHTAQATIDIYVVHIPAKAASKFLSFLKDIELQGSKVDLQHLRRFARFHELPSHLKTSFSTYNHIQSGSCICLNSESLFAIGVPAELIPIEDLGGRVQRFLNQAEAEPRVWVIRVPLFAPTSLEQAHLWTQNFWPTIYKKTNPYGPHPSIISRAEYEIASDVHVWMDLAAEVGSSAKATGIGEAIGAVIVDRQSGQATAVAAAADARWYQSEGHTKCNVMGHAVLRAIGMYTRKLRQWSSDSAWAFKSMNCLSYDIFVDEPLLSPEQIVYETSQISSDRYLCHNLEIYVTHEPCVMCSMALLHSRFGRVVFGQRMPSTGGLYAEAAVGSSQSSNFGHGHGIFWRRELNWCMLTWEISGDEVNDEIDPFLHV